MKALLTLVALVLLAAPAAAQDVSVTITVAAADVATVEAATIDVSNPERVANGESAETLAQYMQRVLDAAVANWKAQKINADAEAAAQVYRDNPARRQAIDDAAAGR